jgi:hypothetical protein
MLIAWPVALVTFLYMLPWAIAATRRKSNSLAIMVLNLLLGWTFVGWIIALVMACSAHQVAAPAVAVANYSPPALPSGAQQPTAAPGWYPQADGSQRYWDGHNWR